MWCRYYFWIIRTVWFFYMPILIICMCLFRPGTKWYYNNMIIITTSTVRRCNFLQLYMRIATDYGSYGVRLPIIYNVFFLCFLKFQYILSNNKPFLFYCRKSRSNNNYLRTRTHARCRFRWWIYFCCCCMYNDDNSRYSQ